MGPLDALLLGALLVPVACAPLFMHKNPTSFARAARLLYNLPSSWVIEVRRG